MGTIDINERRVNRHPMQLWLMWTLATAVGMLLGFIPSALLFRSLDLGLARILIPIIGGLFIGFFQWIVLRSYVSDNGDWILAAGAGWAAAYSIGLLLIELLRGSIGSIAVAYILFGLAIAVFQWPILRREVPNVIPWILANVAGWAAGAFLAQVIVYSLMAQAVEPTSPLSEVVNSAAINGLTGLIAGAVTGLAFVWIVRQPDIARRPVEE